MCVLAAKPLSPEPPRISGFTVSLSPCRRNNYNAAGLFLLVPPPCEPVRRFPFVVIGRGQLKVGVHPSGSFGNKVEIQSAKTKGGEGEGTVVCPR